MKDVQCYELFGGIALKNHASSFFFHFQTGQTNGKCLATQKNLRPFESPFAGHFKTYCQILIKSTEKIILASQ